MTKFNKIFNFRLFVFGFIAFVIGIFVALSFFKSLWFLLGFGILACILCGLFFYFKFHNKFKIYLPRIIAIAICFVVGMIAFSAREGAYRAKLPSSDFYVVEARVASVAETENANFKIEVDNVRLKNLNGRTTTTPKKVVFWSSQKLEVGDKISMHAKFVANEHNHLAELGYSSCGKFVYVTNLSIVGTGKLHVSDKVKNLAWTRLEANVDSTQAGTIYAMIFGDKSKIETQSKENYEAAGVAHILAVSGLHVGFFVLLLSFLFSCIGINKKWRFALLSIGLILYCWLCGFSYSIVRASIMCIVSMFASLRGKQYDGLSALCFSSIIILTFDATQLFAAGFVFSFFTVFAILCFHKMFRDLFSRHFPNWLSNGLSVSIAASIGVYPWIGYHFGYVATYSILFNIILIPIITAIYMLSFVIMIFAMPFSFCGVLLHAPEYLLKGVDIVCHFASGLPGAIIQTSIHPATITLWLSSVLVSCDYCLAKRPTKIYISIALWAITFVLFVLNCFKVF